MYNIHTIITVIAKPYIYILYIYRVLQVPKRHYLRLARSHLVFVATSS